MGSNHTRVNELFQKHQQNKITCQIIKIRCIFIRNALETRTQSVSLQFVDGPSLYTKPIFNIYNYRWITALQLFLIKLLVHCISLYTSQFSHSKRQTLKARTGACTREAAFVCKFDSIVSYSMSFVKMIRKYLQFTQLKTNQ